MLPEAIPFIIFCISLNCFRSVFTSWMEVPEPRATRLRREPSRSAVSLRSSGVMEQTIASTLATSPSSICPAAWRILFGHAGHEAHEPAERAHLLDLPELGEEVVQGELALHEAVGALGHLIGVHGALGLLNQAQNVPHAEDAIGHAVGVEQVEVLETLTSAGEHDRLADDTLDRECGAAAGITVELGEDDAAEFERVVKGFRRRHGVLPDHGVDDQERVVRLDRRGDIPDLLHEVSVDGEAACGVDDADVAAETAGLLQAGLGARHRVRGLAEHRHPGLLAEDTQLLDRSGALQVGADQQRIATLLLPPEGELGRVRRPCRSPADRP